MITSNRIRLRKIEIDDLPRYVSWFNDPEVRHGLAMYLPMSLGEEQDWFQRLSSRPPEEQPFAVDIKTPEGWKHVGSTGLFNFNWRTRRAEFGIMIGDKSVWDQGFGTETARLILKHGFETLNLNRLCLTVHATNKRAIRAYVKAGYIQEGIMRQYEYRDGQHVDVHIMSVLRSEYQP